MRLGSYLAASATASVAVIWEIRDSLKYLDLSMVNSKSLLEMHENL